eukprot:4601430-Pyramimonas_sp.AAC.1
MALRSAAPSSSDAMQFQDGESKPTRLGLSCLASIWIGSTFVSVRFGSVRIGESRGVLVRRVS